MSFFIRVSPELVRSRGLETVLPNTPQQGVKLRRLGTRSAAEETSCQRLWKWSGRGGDGDGRDRGNPRKRCFRAAGFPLALLLSSGTAAAPPATLRMDVMHAGNASSESHSLERVVIEPLPWPGLLARSLDDTDRGMARFEFSDAKTGALLYSRAYSTIFAEWRTTSEAQTLARGFQESLRFPGPDAPVRVRVLLSRGALATPRRWE